MRGPSGVLEMFDIFIWVVVIQVRINHLAVVNYTLIEKKVKKKKGCSFPLVGLS